MSLVVTIAGSPSSPSRSLGLVRHVGRSLAGRGFEVETLSVRDLDPADLLHARFEAESIRAAVRLVERAAGVVVVTPVYKAAYTGVLKAFLDLLPQFGLAGKVVLPLAAGGTLAHALTIDYALRPVLVALGARHVVNGLFLLDKTIDLRADGDVGLDPEVERRLDASIEEFATSIGRHAAARAA